MSNLPATYLDFDINAAEQDLARAKETSSADDSMYIKLAAGETVLRILPPPIAWSDFFQAAGRRPDPFFSVWKHFYERPDQPNKYVVYPCPRKNAGQHCPDCERAEAMKTSQDPLDRDLAGDLEAKHKFLMNVIDRDREDAGPKIYEGSYPWKRFTGKSAFEKIQAVMTGRAKANLITPGPGGYDLVIRKEGSGRTGTVYTFTADRTPRPLHEDSDRALRWIAEQHDLREFVRVPTPQQLVAILRGDAMSPRELHPDGTLKKPRDASSPASARALPSVEHVGRGAPAHRREAATRSGTTAQDYIDTTARPADEDELDF